MGKKRKEESGNETWEIWVHREDGEWMRVVEGGNDGIFANKQRALAIAGAKSTSEKVVEALVIERRPIANFNGPSIALKGRKIPALKLVPTSLGEGPLDIAPGIRIAKPGEYTITKKEEAHGIDPVHSGSHKEGAEDPAEAGHEGTEGRG
jgi:hypothetical protein